MASNWLAYNELAWTEGWLADAAGCEEEAGRYLSILEQHGVSGPATMLHLGSGAGGLDRVFKRHFTVTGVDLSAGMLARARAVHPDIEYIEGDMRSLRLGRTFDIVAIPDSMDYMVSLDDLGRAVRTAAQHVKPGGVVWAVGKTAETFQDNNFAYTGEKDGIHITLFENNTITAWRPNAYEAILVYLIRKDGELTIHTDRHVLGLFPRACWEEVFRKNGLRLSHSMLDGVYDRYLLGEGKYLLHVFVGRG